VEHHIKFHDKELFEGKVRVPDKSRHRMYRKEKNLFDNFLLFDSERYKPWNIRFDQKFFLSIQNLHKKGLSDI